VLTERVEAGYVSEWEALDLAGKILRQSAYEVFSVAEARRLA